MPSPLVLRLRRLVIRQIVWAVLSIHGSLRLPRPRLLHREHVFQGASPEFSAGFRMSKRQQMMQYDAAFLPSLDWLSSCALDTRLSGNYHLGSTARQLAFLLGEASHSACRSPSEAAYTSL